MRRSNACPSHSSRPRPTWALRGGEPCSMSSCLWRFRAWSPARYSRSRSPWATTSLRSWLAAPARFSSATSFTRMSGSPATCPLPPPCRWSRWRSWPSICSGPSASVHLRLCSGGALDTAGTDYLGGADPAFPVRASPADLPVCVQHLEHRELADSRPHAQVVHLHVERRRGAHVAQALGSGWAYRHRIGARPRVLRGLRHPSHDILWQGRGELSLRPPACPPRDHHRDCAEFLLQLQRHLAFDLDHRDRAYDLLHRGRIQQRARTAPPDSGLSGRGCHGPRRKRLSGFSRHHPAAHI